MPGHRERTRIALDRTNLLAGLHMTYIYKVVLTRRGQQLRVVIKAQSSHGPLESRERSHTAQRLGVPQTGNSIGRTGREILPASIKLQADTIRQMRLYVVHLAQVRVA